jgi:hypothetical protein
MGIPTNVEADMIRITILAGVVSAAVVSAAVVSVALVRPSAAEEPRPFVTKVADVPDDEAVPVRRSRHARHYVHHYHERYFRLGHDPYYGWGDYPATCSAVVFPRSPYCDGPTYPYYVGPFWVW